MKIKGENIELRCATKSDRKKIFNWLTKSDLIPSLIGPPNYPDHPMPSYNEFCNEYPLSFFNESGDGLGRNFIIIANRNEVGTIGYDLLDKKKDRVVFDIWMKSEKYCGHCYGSEAIKVLCNHIHKNFGITNFIISPSARNKRAIAAYKKAGFEYVKHLTKVEQIKEFGVSEFDDNILMIKKNK